MILALVYTAVRIIGLETCKVLWHGDLFRRKPLLVLSHALFAVSLSWQVHPAAALAAALLVWPSYLVWPRPGEVPSGWWWEPLWWRSRPIPYGPKPFSDRAHVLSALSSWPVELAAITAVTLPLWGDWLPFTGACALWLAVAALCKWGIWRGPLRPGYWR